jgi:hypothetical protein
MQRKKMLIAGLAIALLIGIASAALIPYFGQVKMTATVKQAVLLDGKDINNMPITEKANVSGGESFCRYHWLKSQTSVPVALTFETSQIDGITVSYYKFGDLSLGPGNFSYRDPNVHYVSSVVLSIKDGVAVWTIDLDGALISGHWSTGTQLLVVTPEKIYSFGISPGAASQPVYKEYISGAWSLPLPVPTGMEATGNVNYEHFVLKIPLNYLVGGMWAINIEASWAGHTGSWWARYPTNWGGWYDFENVVDIYSLATVQLVLPFTLEPGERLDFVICYSFDLLIPAGTYDIYTTVKPAS